MVFYVRYPGFVGGSFGTVSQAGTFFHIPRPVDVDKVAAHCVSMSIHILDYKISRFESMYGNALGPSCRGARGGGCVEVRKRVPMLYSIHHH